MAEEKRKIEPHGDRRTQTGEFGLEKMVHGLDRLEEDERIGGGWKH